MDISIIEYTEDPIKIIYTAARSCYSEGAPRDIKRRAPDKETMLKLIRKVFEMGHHSVFEHAYLTIAISGISRACSHQLVRHRLMSVSQQSQRYVKMDYSKDIFVEPPEIKNNEKAHKFYNDVMKSLLKSYQYLLKLGIKKEDARFLLPNATKTNMVITLNFRELYNISQQRLCGRAQWEISSLFWKIKRLLSKMDGWVELSEFLEPKCVYLGYCPEKNSCGYIDFYKSKKELNR